MCHHTVFIFKCIDIFHAWISVYHMHAVLAETRRGHPIPEALTTGGSEPLCGCWKLNPGPLENHEVLLTAKLYVQFLIHYL